MEKSTKRNLEIGGGILLVGAGLYFGSRFIKKRTLIARSKNYSSSDESALSLGIALGFEYPIWSPLRWSEDDSDAFTIASNIPAKDVNSVKAKYAKRYGRDLAADLQKYLPASDWLRLRSKFVK